MILEVYNRKGKEFVAIVAVRGELGEKKRELVSRNVRKEDATFAKGKLVEIYTNMEIDTWKSFGCRLCRAKDEWMNHFNLGLIEVFLFFIQSCKHSIIHLKLFGSEYNFSQIIIRFSKAQAR